MPFTVVQTKTAVSTVAGTAITATLTSPPTEDSLLLAVVMHTGVNLCGNSSWSNLAYASQNVNTVYHYATMAGVATTSTFSVTSPSSVTWALCLREYSIDGGDVDYDSVTIDASPAAGSATYAMATVGLSGENDLVVASFAQQNTARTATSFSGGFTEFADLQPGPTSSSLASADSILTSVGVDQSTTITLSGTTSSIPAWIIQSFSSQAGPTRSRTSQQTAPGGW